MCCVLGVPRWEAARHCRTCRRRFDAVDEGGDDGESLETQVGSKRGVEFSQGYCSASDKIWAQIRVDEAQAILLTAQCPWWRT